MKKWIIKNFKDKKGRVDFFNVEKIYPTIQLNKEKYLEIDLTVTDKCNLNCWYCIENCQCKKSLKEMSKEDFNAILNMLKSFNINYYSRILLYGGECTTNKNIDFLLYELNKNKYISPILFTNATWDIEYIKHLININKQMRFCVTFHDSILKNKLRETVINNLKYIRSLGLLQRFYILFDSLNKSNIDIENTILHLYKELNIDTYISNIEGYRRNKIYYKIHLLENCDIKKRMELAKFLPREPIKIKFFDDDKIYKFPEELIQKYKFYFNNIIRCKAGLQYLYIKTDGSVYSCEEEHFYRGTIYDKIELKESICKNKACDVRFTYLEKDGIKYDKTNL